MPNSFARASEEIAARFNRLHNIVHPLNATPMNTLPLKGLDGQNVRDHANHNAHRNTTIRFIATREARGGVFGTLNAAPLACEMRDGPVEDDGFITVYDSSAKK